MDERSRKIERLEMVQKHLSIIVSIASFWIIAVFWNYYDFGNLELIPRLGFSAALSWVAFLHTEETGMIIMTMMREKWREEARDAREAERDAREAERDAKMEAQKAQLQTQIVELQAREAQVEAREREAQAQETIRDLRRRLEAAENGEAANVGKA